MQRLVKLGVGISLVVVLAVGNIVWAQAPGLANLNTLILTREAGGARTENLFKSVLDALNEARYVEPPVPIPNRLPGAPPRPARVQIQQQRDGAGYQPSNAVPLSASTTTLSDLVTRSITLEGQDLRTQERSDQYAREVVRQRQLASVIEKLCREAFGSDKCELQRQDVLDPQQAKEILRQRERAFVTDPLALAGIPIEHGALAVLDSFKPEYQAKAKQVLNEAKQGGQVLPLAYSSEIAEIRRTLESENPAVGEVFENIVEKVKAGYRPRPFDVNVWVDHLRATAGQNNIPEVEFLPSSGSSSEQEISDHGLAISEIIDVEGELRGIAEAAKTRVAGQLFSTIVDSAIPDRAQVVRPGYEDDPIGDIRIVDTTPANVKEGLQEGLLLTIAQAVANPNFTDPAQVNNPPGGVAAADKDNQGNFPNLALGQPLNSFEQNKVIKEGLYHHTGVTLVPGLYQGNFLQAAIPEIIKAIRP